MAEDSLLGTHSTQESINQVVKVILIELIKLVVYSIIATPYSTHGHLLHTSNKDSRTLASYSTSNKEIDSFI